MTDERRPRAVLFDLDGTLIDSIELIRRSFRHMLFEHGFDGNDDSLWRRGIGRPLDVQLAELARDPADVGAMVATYRAYNNAHHDELVTAFPGVRESLETLRAAGQRLGIVTSKARTGALRGLAHTGLANYFDVIVAANDVVRPKPASDPVLAALATLDVAPERATTVGDALPDLQAGRAAGTRTVAVLWGACDRATLETVSPDLVLESRELSGRSDSAAAQPAARASLVAETLEHLEHLAPGREGAAALALVFVDGGDEGEQLLGHLVRADDGAHLSLHRGLAGGTSAGGHGLAAFGAHGVRCRVGWGAESTRSTVRRLDLECAGEEPRAKDFPTLRSGRRRVPGPPRPPRSRERAGSPLP